MFQALAHVAFLVSDREASLRFYRDALGLTPQFEMEDEEGRPWIQYLKIADRQFLELFCPHPGEAPGPAPDTYYRHLCLECADLPAVVDTLRERGVAIDIEPHRGADGNWQAWIHDPDGNRIELRAYTPDSPQLRQPEA